MQMTFSQRLNKVLNLMQISQREFAKRLDIDKSKASRLLNGIGSPDLELLQKMRIQFAINLEWLICGIGKMRIDDTNIAMEPEVSYSIKNIDKEIQAMRETIETQKKLISMQEQIISKYEKEPKQDRQAG